VNGNIKPKDLVCGRNYSNGKTIRRITGLIVWANGNQVVEKRPAGVGFDVVYESQTTRREGRCAAGTFVDWFNRGVKANTMTCPHCGGKGFVPKPRKAGK
jgi:hypothetical protein